MKSRLQNLHPDFLCWISSMKTEVDDKSSIFEDLELSELIPQYSDQNMAGEDAELFGDMAT